MNDNKIIENKLKQYQIQSKQDEFNALKETFQEIALGALCRTEFFKVAAFQGGTCLRIFHGLQRFSEDLDFILMQPKTSFDWGPFLNKIRLEFASFDLNLEVKERASLEGSIKTAFIKEDSFGQILSLNYKRSISDIQKIHIKLEIDVDPPLGSEYEIKLLEFPYFGSVTVQDLKSLFATKCHALLCRQFCKGRDWFDFTWYVAQRLDINFELLHHAFYQSGPWKQKIIKFNKAWLISALKSKILETNWEQAKNDVIRFLKPKEADVLKLWNKEFFLIMVEKLNTYL